VAHESRESQLRNTTYRKSSGFVAGVLITDMHRWLPSDEIDRRHDGWIVRVKPLSADRFAFDVIHTGLDARRSPLVPTGSRRK
jgi:hypothetical protein